jgi:ABC-2 type transport system permease protein
MTTWQITKLLAAREIGERLRSKAFLASTAVTLAIVLGIALLPGLVGGDDTTTYDIGVSGRAAEELALALPAAADGLGDVAVDVRTVDPAEGERLVRDGDLDAVLLDGEVVVHEELTGDLELLVQATSAEVSSRAALAEAGVSGAAVEAALHPDPLEVRALDPPDPDEDDRDGIVFLGTVLLYGQLFGFGYWVASGLVEEKSSRVAELLLTKARPSQVLLGKIVGLGVVGFVQLLAIVAVGIAAAAAADAIDFPPGMPGVVAMVLGWFVLGYAFYSCLFAIGGALASRAEELQTTTTPVSMVVVASFFAAMFTQDDPGGTLAVVTTYIPTTAPLVLPIRQAAGELAAYELVGSIAIVLATTFLVVRVASKVYAGAALHVRGSLKLREALRRAE